MTTAPRALVGLSTASEVCVGRLGRAGAALAAHDCRAAPGRHRRDTPSKRKVDAEAAPSSSPEPSSSYWLKISSALDARHKAFIFRSTDTSNSQSSSLAAALMCFSYLFGGAVSHSGGIWSIFSFSSPSTTVRFGAHQPFDALAVSGST